MAVPTSLMSAPVASQRMLREFMLEILSASMALAASLDSSEDHVSMVSTFSEIEDTNSLTLNNTNYYTNFYIMVKINLLKHKTPLTKNFFLNF